MWLKVWLLVILLLDLMSRLIDMRYFDQIGQIDRHKTSRIAIITAIIMSTTFFYSFDDIDAFIGY